SEEGTEEGGGARHEVAPAPAAPGRECRGTRLLPRQPEAHDAVEAHRVAPPHEQRPESPPSFLCPLPMSDDAEAGEEELHLTRQPLRARAEFDSVAAGVAVGVEEALEEARHDL